LLDKKGEAQINPQQAVKAVPVGNGHPEFKVPSPPGWDVSRWSDNPSL